MFCERFNGDEGRLDQLFSNFSTEKLMMICLRQVIGPFRNRNALNFSNFDFFRSSLSQSSSLKYLINKPECQKAALCTKLPASSELTEERC